MAKKSVINRNEKRKSLQKKHEAERLALRAIAHDKSLSQGERFSAFQKLAKLPRNSAPSRYGKRCVLTGRKRAYYGKFGVSRIVLRTLASSGELPGVKKASW